MVLIRSAAGRPLGRLLRASRPTLRQSPTSRINGRRFYAVEGSSHTSGGSDWPWAIGAAAVTIPACAYLLANDPTGKDSGHGHGHDEHDEKHEDKEEGGEKEEEEKGEEESSENDGKETEESKEEPSEESTDKKESEETKEKGGKEEESKDEDKEESKDEGKKGPKDDTATTGNREPSGHYSQSGKQEGVSNADTKHSTTVHDDPGKSKKGEGVAETAKLKGTVSRDRPLR